MAETNKTDKTPNDDADEMEKILSVVVKRRKTIPTKCMELMKEAASYDLLRLEKAKIVLDGRQSVQNFKQTFFRIVQGTNNLISAKFSLDDFEDAKKKHQRHEKRKSEIKHYLERRKKYAKHI